MKAERIEETLACLPPGSTLYCENILAERVPRFELERRRYSRAVLDPGYAWAFVMEFVKRRLPLPAGLTAEEEAYLVPAHQKDLGLRRFGEVTRLCSAQSLNLFRALWNGILCRPYHLL